MTVKEIKKTQEVVVRTEYVANDGEIFHNEAECKKYEESALFVVSNKLKRIKKKNGREFSQYDFNEEYSDEYIVDVFNIENQTDLDNLAMYLKLFMAKNGASEKAIADCFKADVTNRTNFVFERLTVGHEVLIFWNYDMDWFWVYGDGSINAYFEYFKNKITNLIYPEKETENE